MTKSAYSTGKQVKEFYAVIGKDSMLVQGAGGNVSWKDDEVLWVKASGTWLKDALAKDIFVPIELLHLRKEIAKKNFQVIPKVIGNSILRPSIETLLHALMPQKVVVHLHAIEILAHLVRTNPVARLDKLIGNNIKWSIVDYFKPGAELAEAVAKNLSQNFDVDVIFLRNHGVVIGGESIGDIDIILQKLIVFLKNKITHLTNNIKPIDQASLIQLSGYKVSQDEEISQLATYKSLSARLKSEWVLYPDHAVFLGSFAPILGESIDYEDINSTSNKLPAFIFDLGVCVYEKETITTAEKDQLRCYYDVLIRQIDNDGLVSLPPDSIMELLDWDAEKYRQRQ